MPKYQLELSDVGAGDSALEEMAKAGFKSPRESSGGCFVSSRRGFFLVVVVAALVVGVALAVFFTSSRDRTCTSGGTGVQDAVTSCKEWVTNGGTASEDICNVCPSPPTPRPPTATATTTKCRTDGNTTTANTTATTTPPIDRNSYRLPGHVTPLHYTVQLQPDIYHPHPSNFSFTGTLSLRLRCDGVTDVITLHLDRLNVSDSDVSVTQDNSPRELFQSSRYDEVRQFWHLQLSVPLEVGKIYVISVRHFSGPLTTDGKGLYYSYYMDGDTTVYLATTQMEPLYARKTFPCLDEPQLKATFNITLVRRNDVGRQYISLANAPYSDSQYVVDAEGQVWVKDTFQTTPRMPTYLLAFIVCDYQHWENTTTSYPLIMYRTYARPNSIQWAQRAQLYGLKLFRWLDTRFQPPYGQALSKMDHIAIPDFNFGAMENWGLITYREAILYQPGVTSASNEFWMASVITHEIAHMWFGNYVSPKWWNWLWLNEAFASWWDVYVTGQVFPDWDVLSDWVSLSLYSVMDSDALATSHPMNADVMTPAEIAGLFDSITYAKGAAIVRMMHFIMGLDTFIDGLNMHLAANLYGNADAADLFTALDQKMKEENFGEGYMTSKMDPWVSQMGFPVVMVNRTTNGYQLTQKRFLIGSEEDTDDRYKDAPYNYQWEIPIIYATSDDTNMEKSRDHIHWISKHSDLVIPDPTVNDTGAWILININQTAYCHVLYDTDTWHALIGQLNSDPTVIPPLSRGQIINDAWSLAKAGLLDMSVALSTVGLMQAETHLVTWRAFRRHMAYLELMLDATDLYPLLQTFMRKTLQKPLQTLTLNINENMVPTDVFVRTLIAGFACDYGLVGCVNVAKRLFTEWRNTGINRINANLRSQFYCTSVAEGDVTDWEFVYTQYKASDDTTERTNLRRALSCSRDQTLLRRLLRMTLDPAEVRTQDVRRTVQYVAANPLGRHLAFQFFVDNFEDIRKRVVVGHLSKVLLSVTAHFNTEYNLQQLEQLLNVQYLAGVRPAWQQAMARTRSNMAWLRTHYDVIKDWLVRQQAGPSTPSADSYRLPPHLVPYHYELSLQPHLYGGDPRDFFFEGNVTIFFTCTSDTDVITLHQKSLTIHPSSITVANVINPDTSLPVADVTEEEQFHFYKIHLGQRLRERENYSVEIVQFRGQLTKKLVGLYLSSYWDGNRTIYLATTQMAMVHAREALPCFDEPQLKATFDVTLVRRHDTDRDYITLFNTPLNRSMPLDGSWTADTFQRSMLMPTYLLAFVVCDFSYLSDESAKYNVETRTYARPNRIADAALGHSYAVRLLDWYNDHFEPNYDTFLSKVDHIVIPDFMWGAMENWGLITYRERLLYNSMSTASDRSWVAEITSHELAHMWFGNKVTPQWWTWAWLNEAFADYWGCYAVEQLHPTWKKCSVVDMVKRVFHAMQIDSYPTSRPMTHPVHTPADIMNQFDTISYTKGGAIIGMMHMIMGEHFIPALNVYLTDHQLGNTDHKDLFDSLNKYISTTAGIDVNMTEKMEPWVTQMGYPVVNVHRDGSRLVLSQHRFLLGSASPSDTGTYGYKYSVPITYTTSSEKNFNKSRTDIVWLPVDGSNRTIQLTSSNDNWVVVNLRHEGYYRVNYDVTTWRALIGQLNNDHTVFHQVNRAALLDDAFNLAKAELLPLEIALQTLDYMNKETDYGPWRVFARETDQIAMMVERSKLFGLFQRLMRDLVDGPIKTLGFNVPQNNEPPVDVYTKVWVITLACKYGHMMCVNLAVSSVSNWMNGMSNSINVNLRSVMYCTAVREGGYEVWQFIFQRYQFEQDATEKARLCSALGCSTDPAILYTFLNTCLYDYEVPRHETSSCVTAVANNRYGRDVALNFLMEHFPQLRDRFGAGDIGKMVGRVTQHFHNNFHLAQLQFLRDTYDVSGIVTKLDTVRQRTLTNMKWVEYNLHTVKQWLTTRYPI